MSESIFRISENEVQRVIECMNNIALALQTDKTTGGSVSIGGAKVDAIVAAILAAEEVKEKGSR